jgi:hypothetical protein
MAEQRSRARWKDMPEFRTIYKPWSDRLVQSEPVKKIVSKIVADQIALKLCGTTLLPDLDDLRAPVTAEVGGTQRDYVIAYEGKDKEEGQGTIIITDEERDQSILLRPSSKSGYSLAINLGKTAGSHVFESSSRLYSPYPFIEEPGLRIETEQIIGSVSKVLAA